MHFRRQHDILPTLQERRSWLTLGRCLLGKDAERAADAIVEEQSRLLPEPAAPPPATTAANLHRHEAVQDAIGLRAHFCDPNSPWQRGSIENIHGRLRRGLPRKISLGGYLEADIDDVI
jgi:IS30 family transposase